MLSQGKRPAPPKSQEEVTNAKEAYEQKCERDFLSCWQIGQPWLGHDAVAKVMYCSTCRTAGLPESDSVFVNGTRFYPIDGIIFFGQA